MNEIQKTARFGRFTASEIHKLMGVKGLGKTGETYILEKVTQLLGVELNEVSAPAMQWGNEWEGVAAEYYAAVTNDVILESAFIVPNWCADCGASPDRIVVGKSKLIEIKCPYNPVTHTRNLMLKTASDLKELHPEYYWQVQMQLAVTEFKECDFVSFHPYFEGANRMLILPIQANTADIELLKTRIFEAVKIRNEFFDLIK